MAGRPNPSAFLAYWRIVWALICACSLTAIAIAEPVPAQAQTNSVTAAPTYDLLERAVRDALAGNSNSLAAGAVSQAPTNAAIASVPASATNAAPIAATNESATISDTRKLSIRDRISFKIAEDEDGPTNLFVTDSGDLEVPYIGRVAAQNKTCNQLASEIKAALEKDYYYHATVVISVDIMANSHGSVYLAGAVRAPGRLELPSDEKVTVSQAILRSGSFLDYADRRHVKVTRMDANNNNRKETFTVNVADILDAGKVELDLVLQPGDLINIPERLVRF